MCLCVSHVCVIENGESSLGNFPLLFYLHFREFTQLSGINLNRRSARGIDACRRLTAWENASKWITALHYHVRYKFRAMKLNPFFSERNEITLYFSIVHQYQHTTHNTCSDGEFWIFFYSHPSVGCVAILFLIHLNPSLCTKLLGMALMLCVCVVAGHHCGEYIAAALLGHHGQIELEQCRCRQCIREQ